MNAAANRWKHAGDWDWSVADPQRSRTLKVFSAVVNKPLEQGDSYVTTNVLGKFSHGRATKTARRRLVQQLGALDHVGQAGEPDSREAPQSRPA